MVAVNCHQWWGTVMVIMIRWGRKGDNGEWEWWGYLCGDGAFTYFLYASQNESSLFSNLWSVARSWDTDHFSLTVSSKTMPLKICRYHLKTNIHFALKRLLYSRAALWKCIFFKTNQISTLVELNNKCTATLENMFSSAYVCQFRLVH